MKKYITVLPLVFGLLFGSSGAIYAQEVSTDDIEKIYAYAQIDSLADMLVESLSAKRTMIETQLESGQLIEGYKRVYEKILDLPAPEEFGDSVREEFISSFDTTHVNPILEWYESPLGKKVLMIDNQTEVDQEALAVFRSDESNFTDDRVEIFADILNASGIYTIMIDLAVSAEEAAMDASLDYAQEKLRSNEMTEAQYAELESQYANKMQNLETELENSYDQYFDMFLSIMAYSYRELSLEELEKINAFYQSDSAKYLFAYALDAVIQANYDYAYAVGNEFAKAVEAFQ